MLNIFRLIIACVIFACAITLCFFGFWWWGILVLFIGGIVLLSFFFNENMVIAQWFLRKENNDKAEIWLLKIKDYEKELNKNQHGYYNLLIGLVESRKAPMKSEKILQESFAIRHEDVAQHRIG